MNKKHIHTNNTIIEHKTWGRSRSNRLTNYDYSSDRPIHIIICSKDKKDIFNNEIKAKFIIYELIKSIDDLNYIIFCYCLMPDHLHIVISPSNSGVSLSKFLNIFKGRTTTAFRNKYGVKGLWQRSAYDHIIRAEEDLKAIIEYILNNPVRKGIVERAEDYPFSKLFENKIKRYLR